MTPIKVTLVKYNAKARESLSILINGFREFTCIGAFSTAETALRQLPQQWPDVVVMDINLPKILGIEFGGKLELAAADDGGPSYD